jgi:hypothetical protein
MKKRRNNLQKEKDGTTFRLFYCEREAKSRSDLWHPNVPQSTHH